MNTEKLLILGASSFVGRHLFDLIGADKAIGTFNANPIPGGVRFDSASMDLADVITDPGSIRQAVLLLGDTQPNSCFVDQERSQLVNVTAIERVLDRLKEWNIRPIFTSSEFVFDGNQGGYTETDATNPILIYGRQKLAVESCIERNFSDYAILRLAKVYGEEPDDGTLFSGLMHASLQTRVMRIAKDQKFSPVFVGDVCAAIRAAADRPLQGIYHVAGPDALTRLACLDTALGAICNYRDIAPSIETCSILDFDLPEERPIDVSMCPEKLVTDTGITLRTAKESCDAIASKIFAEA